MSVIRSMVLNRSEGFQTNAVFGFTRMLIKLMDDRNPEYVGMFFDAKGPTFRHAMYADYKANRPPAPPDLHQQMLRVREIVDAWGMTPLEAPGFEADDIIATLVLFPLEVKTHVIEKTEVPDTATSYEVQARVYREAAAAILGRPVRVSLHFTHPNTAIDV